MRTAEQVVGYDSSLEHVLASLELLDARLRTEVARFRARTSEDPDGLRAFYVSDAEIDTLISPRNPMIDDGESSLTAVDRLRPEIDARVAATTVPLRLAGLASAFGLSPAEVDAVLVALAPEVDRRYERLYAYLQDDVTRRRPGSTSSCRWPAPPEYTGGAGSRRPRRCCGTVC